MTLKEARKAKNMTLVELAAAVGMSARHLHRFEKGQFRIGKMAVENLIRIADVLEVDLYDLIEMPR